MIGLLWIAVFTLAVVVWLLALTVAVLKDDLIALHADVRADIEHRKSVRVDLSRYLGAPHQERPR